MRSKERQHFFAKQCDHRSPDWTTSQVVNLEAKTRKTLLVSRPQFDESQLALNKETTHGSFLSPEIEKKNGTRIQKGVDRIRF